MGRVGIAMRSPGNARSINGTVARRVRIGPRRLESASGKVPGARQGLEARSGQLGAGVGGLAAGVEDFGAALPPHMAERLRLSGG